MLSGYGDTTVKVDSDGSRLAYITRYEWLCKNDTHAAYQKTQTWLWLPDICIICYCIVLYVCVMPAHRLRRWPNITQTYGCHS